MKKLILTAVLFGCFANAYANDSQNKALEDEAIKAQKIAFNTDMFKVKTIKIQLKQNTDLVKAVRLLNELKPAIEKVEKQIR